MEREGNTSHAWTVFYMQINCIARFITLVLSMIRSSLTLEN